MFRDQLRTALAIAWLVVTSVVLSIQAAPFFLSADTITALTPVCEWKAKYHRECPVCGMTTGFILISNGRLREAERHNRGSVPLWVLWLVNECAGAWFVLTQLRRKPHDRLWAATVRMPTEELSCRS
jgi:hypothetical protein